MPELPEVETIKTQLNKFLIGKKIKAVDINLAKLVKNITANQFEKKIIGATIKYLRRRAKILIINLSNELSLAIHLKMSGQLIYQKKHNPKNVGKHTHLIYYFADGGSLMHNDMRQFGYVKLLPTEKINKLLEIEEKLGPEPLEKKFTLEEFKKLLLNKKTARIKPLLMDPKFIAGIGNIYSDEILFYAKVRPMRLVASLKPEETSRIYQGIKKILPEAIRYHGTSAELYVDALGKEGNYKPHLKVYGRTNQSCVGCKGKVESLKINGRTAHFCPSCQK